MISHDTTNTHHQNTQDIQFIIPFSLNTSTTPVSDPTAFDHLHQAEPPDTNTDIKVLTMVKTVLITGASGYIATHTIDSFLRQGYNVRGTVRSQKSASEVLKTHAKYPGQLTTVIVPDIAAPNAFDEAVKGVDGVSQTLPGYLNRHANRYRLSI